MGQKGIRRLRKNINYLENLSLYADPIVIVPRKCPQGSPIQETKRLCIVCRKLNAQLPVIPGNKSSDTLILVDIQRNR